MTGKNRDVVKNETCSSCGICSVRRRGFRLCSDVLRLRMNDCFAPCVPLCQFCQEEFSLKCPSGLGLSCSAATAVRARCGAVGSSHAWHMQF